MISKVYQKKYFLIFLFSLSLVLLPVNAVMARKAAALNVQITPTMSIDTPEPTPTPEISYDKEIAELELQINSLQTRLDLQSEFYNSTVARMESNFNQLINLLTYGSIALTILGIISVRIWIKNYIENQINKKAISEIDSKTDELVGEFRAEWEGKFVDLYNEYKRIIRH